MNSLHFMRAGLLAALLSSAWLCYAQTRPDSEYERTFHSTVPLGAERIDLSSGKTMYVLATAESPRFEGWTARDNGTQRTLFNSDGSPARFYPRHLEFRLTATAMRPDLLAIDSYGRLNISADEINNYILSLGFRVLVFHGLEITRVEPAAVHLIGMPADVNYDERVYQLVFDMPHVVPTDDRIVLEVLSPNGSRICKFHLDFF